MCGIAGIANLKQDIRKYKDVLYTMTCALENRGPDEEGYFFSDTGNILLGHRRLSIIDIEGGKQPMTRKYKDSLYTIIYNGQLYNSKELRRDLKLKGASFESFSDTEVILMYYIYFGEECVKYFNGIFAIAIWDEANKSLFLARDPIGVKPLFYTVKEDTIIFASEIKAILAHPLAQPIIDKEGLCELFGLGPGRDLGSGVFKDIHEIKPGNYIIYNQYGIHVEEYWKLNPTEFKEDINEASNHVKYLIIDSVKRQLVSDVPICTFLSGGLDSSAISAIAANYFKENKLGVLGTYFVDYKGNDIYYKSNDFEPDPDIKWSIKMSDFLGTNHHKVLIDPIKLASALDDALIANDIPGMADIDSSLYLFCKEIKKDASVILSGECADELFGGYPWYYKEEGINSTTFPWSNSLDERCSILSKEFKGLPIKDYVASKYEETLKSVPHIDGESKIEYRMRELFYLNIKWFMITLLNRADRMGMANGLETRVPFADIRIVEYAFNIPPSIKLYEGREKGLLRYALKGILPEDIIQRKKSPYPKTHNPLYTKEVQNKMREVLKNKQSPIHELVDIKKVTEIVETGGESFKKPWYGQLMRGPQLIAYLYQLDTWLRKYSVKIV
jgi:asparagine synthase (glutamine-hydrolysing)